MGEVATARSVVGRRAIMTVATVLGLVGSVLVSGAAAEPGQAPSCGGVAATIVGTPGADRLVGTSGADVIVGLGGDDVITGRGGSDVVCGGVGDDRIVGGRGGDRLFGQRGDDRIDGRGGRDVVNGGPDADHLSGGTGRDRVVGGTGEPDVCAGERFAACEVEHRTRHDLPATVRVRRDLHYATDDGQELLLDVYDLKPTRRTGPRPLVVFVPWGVVADAKDDPVAQHYAADLATQGVVAAVLDYRPGGVLNIPIADIQRAVSWLKDNAATYGIDPDRVYLAGRERGSLVALTVHLSEFATSAEPVEVAGAMPLSVGFFDPRMIRHARPVHFFQGSRDPDTAFIRDWVCELFLPDDCELTVYDTGQNLEAFHDDIVDRMIEFVG